MTIDIEKLIADIDEDGSGEIEYDEFRNLLSSSDWNLLTIPFSINHYIDKESLYLQLIFVFFNIYKWAQL